MMKDIARPRVTATAGQAGVPHTLMAHCSMKSATAADHGMKHDARRFARLMDSMSPLLCVVSNTGRLEYCNSSWRRVFVAGEGDSLAPAVIERLHPEDRECWIAHWNEARERGRPYWSEHRVRRPASPDHLWCRECADPVLDEDGAIESWVITGTWIDEQRRTEDELRSLVARKDAFFATLLHELRNPLAPIANALELLGRHPTDVQIVTRSRGIIQRQLRQLTRLVDDLLDVSRLERGNFELQSSIIDVAEVVATAIEAARPLIELRKHHLASSLPRGIYMVRGDPVRLGQVLTNLLINAAKYTEPGGYISVRGEQTEKDVLIHVRDSGVGIAREQFPHIFELFAQPGTSHAARMGGLGVGLAVARQLIELHGGTITALSEGPGCGSEFSICLPRTDDTAASRG
jgi:signal transduction histidine kinase